MPTRPPPAAHATAVFLTICLGALGGTVFAAAALMVAYKVVSFWTGYANQLKGF